MMMNKSSGFMQAAKLMTAKPSTVSLMTRGFYYPDANHHHLNQEVRHPWDRLNLFFSLMSSLRESWRQSEIVCATLILRDGMESQSLSRLTGTVRMITSTSRPACWCMTLWNVNSASILMTEGSCFSQFKTASTSSWQCTQPSEELPQPAFQASYRALISLI